MKKIKWLIMVSVATLLLGACGNEAEKKELFEDGTTTMQNPNTEDDSDYFCEEITENMLVALKLPEIQVKSAKIYRVKERTFDINKAAEIWGVDLTEAEYFKNELSACEFFEGNDGWQISGGIGNFTYYDCEEMYELKNIIKRTHEEELQEFSPNDVLDEEIGRNIEFAKAILEKVYQPGEEEKFVLLKAVKAEKEEMLEYQKKMEEEGFVGTGKADMHRVSENLMGEDTYYFSFGLTINGIMRADLNNGFGYMLADMDVITAPLFIEMIVKDDRVTFLYISSAFAQEEMEEKELISVQQAIDVLKKKYELEIIPEEEIISEVQLEYVFVSDAKSDCGMEGTFVPYWRFDSETAVSSERINAITGADFQYE